MMQGFNERDVNGRMFPSRRQALFAFNQRGLRQCRRQTARQAPFHRAFRTPDVCSRVPTRHTCAILHANNLVYPILDSGDRHPGDLAQQVPGAAAAVGPPE